MSPTLAYVMGIATGVVFTVVAYAWFELIDIWRHGE